MKEHGLFSKIRRKRKWVNLGQEAHKYKNLLNRQFHANCPNTKWVTDISYIQTKEGVLYLSMIRDLYDNSIVAYKTAAHQTVNLVLDTIRLSMKNEKEKVAVELQLHSDQGFQYTSQAYFKLTQEYGITPSMSRRGNPYDNALTENFFGILKAECIYRHKPRTLAEADELINRYIYFYNHERIQLSQNCYRTNPNFLHFLPLFSRGCCSPCLNHFSFLPFSFSSFHSLGGSYDVMRLQKN